jgi:hypothetical protein
VNISVCRPVVRRANRQAAQDDVMVEDSLEDGSSNSDDDNDGCSGGGEEDDDDDDTMVNEVQASSAGRNDWGSIDTTNTFSSFDVDDDVMAWFDDKYYHAL